jgi:hypothetical protein
MDIVKRLSLMAAVFLIGCGFNDPLPNQADSVKLTDYSKYVTYEDWTPALLEALKESNHIIIPKGTYKMSELCVPSGKTIEGQGSETVIIPIEEHLFRVKGSAGDEIPLADDMSDFSNSANVVTAEGLCEGDMVILKSQRNCMFREDAGEWTLGQTISNNKTCFFGEMLTIANVSGNLVTFTTPTLFPSYYCNSSRETIKENFISRSTATVQKISSVKDVLIQNLKIQGNDICDNVISLIYAEDCAIEKVIYEPQSISDQLSYITMTLSRNCLISKCQADFPISITANIDKNYVKDYQHYSNYNIFKIVSSQSCGIESCSSNCSTHAFNITYSNGSIPSIKCLVSKCYASNSIWAGVISQQCTPWSELIGNTVEHSGQGVLAGSLYSTIADNNVSTDIPFSNEYYYVRKSRGGSAGVGFFEGYGRHGVIKNNSAKGFYTGIIILDGYEALNSFDYADDIIEGNMVSDCPQGFYISRNEDNSARTPLGIILRDNNFTGPGINAKDGINAFGVRIFKNCCDVTVSGNSILQYRFGIYMSEFPNLISMENNLIGTCKYGIFLKDVSSITGQTTIQIHDKNNSFINVDTPRKGLEQLCVKAY